MFKDILAISGEPGLYKLVTKTQNGLIVEHVETKKRQPAYAAAKISSLDDIAIFTESEDKPLKDVFKAIYEKENGQQAISHKVSKNELVNYFSEILPDYDKDRVYISDIKKAINWYNLLQKVDMLDFTEEEKNEEESQQKNDTKEENS